MIKFNVGDAIVIKSAWDEDLESCDYPRSFTEEMLRDFGGKTAIIKEIQDECSKYDEEDFKRFVECPHQIYRLDIDCKEYQWTAPMFEGVCLKGKTNGVKPEVCSDSSIIPMNDSDDVCVVIPRDFPIKINIE